MNGSSSLSNSLKPGALRVLRNTFLFLLAALLAGACQTVPVTGRRQMILVPNAQLLPMAYDQYSQFLSQNRLSSDRRSAERVRNIGVRIQRAVETYMTQNNMADRLSGFQWEFNLVEDNTVNAWCMPGGKVVFYTGILPVCQNDDGIAVVMGHEIAHAIAEHGAERMSQGLLQQGLDIGVALATANRNPQVQAIFQTAFGVSSQLGVLAFSRQQESEADKLGLIFSSMAGFDPREAPRFWERMSAASQGGAPPEFMSTHPSHDRRIRDLQAQMPDVVKIYEQNKK